MKQKFNPEIWLVDRQQFNPAEWIQKPKAKKAIRRLYPQVTATSIQYEVEVVVRRIETNTIDLTMNYEDWVKLGFAFSSEFGEGGRGYFHRVSRYHIGYELAKCDRQFDKCLKGRKTGITIKSFFAAAHNAGVNVKV